MGAAQSENDVVQLPKKHCAFKGCGWTGHSDSEQLEHLTSAHQGAVDRVAELLPICYSAAERRAAAYSEAIAVAVRQGAPTALYSIDRRCLYNYAMACHGAAVEAPICFFCACVYPRLASRSSNDIRWVTPFDGQSRLCDLKREQVASVFGTEKFLERYGCCNGGVPDLTQHLDEFSDWEVEIPFAEGAVRIICCPEDKCCERGKACSPTALCSKCMVPVCRHCEKSVYGPEPEMPSGCLANDLMVFYAQREIYTEEMTVVEMICCSVCITSMICFSLEVRYGSLFNTQVHMHRHRVGARGTATTFPMSWQQLLGELQRLDSEQAEGNAPDLPKVGAD